MIKLFFLNFQNPFDKFLKISVFYLLFLFNFNFNFNYVDLCLNISIKLYYEPVIFIFLALFYMIKFLQSCKEEFDRILSSSHPEHFLRKKGEKYSQKELVKAWIDFMQKQVSFNCYAK